jgi:hypothetical protein
MSTQPAPLMIGLNPAWPASQMAAVILEQVRNAYGERLNIAGIHEKMDEIWVDLQRDLTDDEKQRLGDVSHVSIPLNDFNARIVSPPSRLGYFIVFDAMIDLRLWDLFTAPRHAAAWSAAYVRAAWGAQFSVAHWVGPEMELLTNRQNAKEFTDSYSLAAAREFIFAHECGHFFLKHLQGGARRQFNMGGGNLQAFDAGLQQEVEADAFACDLLARTTSRPLGIQQMGVDWLLGFLGAVHGMRRRAESRRTGAPDSPIVDPAIAHRRQLCWDDFNRRRATSPNENERTPEANTTIERVRMNVDNFNEHRAAALADIYAELPDELMSFYERVSKSPMTEDEMDAHELELEQLEDKAAEHYRTTPRLRARKGRLSALLQRLF